MKNYEWFRFHVKRGSNSACSVHVSSSLDSREFEDSFVAPFDEAETEKLLREIENSVNSGKPIGQARLRDVGERLYRFVFFTAA